MGKLNSDLMRMKSQNDQDAQDAANWVKENFTNGGAVAICDLVNMDEEEMLAELIGVGESLLTVFQRFARLGFYTAVEKAKIDFGQSPAPNDRPSTGEER
jgi:hypothetical protein